MSVCIHDIDMIVDPLDHLFDPSEESTNHLQAYKVSLEDDISDVEDLVGELEGHITEIQERIDLIDDVLADRGEADE